MGNLARNSRLLAAVVLTLFASVGLAGAAGYSQETLLVEHWNGSAWTESGAPAPKGDSGLSAATAISASDVWAVGTTSHDTPVSNDFWSYPIAAHWNGASWQTMRLPTPHRTWPYVLDAVSASAANDVWATGGSAAGTLIEHWNGERWKNLRRPNYLAGFFGVAALSRHNVWFVGVLNGRYEPKMRSFIEHWNGHHWRHVAAPSPNGSVLVGVAAASARDIWAVGGYSTHHRSHQLLLHWNGVAWKQFRGPALRAGSSLSAVDVISANDAWAVGSGGSGSLVEHWNGRRWSVVRVPVLKDSYLNAVAGLNADDVWVLGLRGKSEQTFAIHWDGVSWTVVPAVDRPDADGLYGITAVASGDVWAVGDSNAP